MLAGSRLLVYFLAALPAAAYTWPQSFEFPGWTGTTHYSQGAGQHWSFMNAQAQGTADDILRFVPNSDKAYFTTLNANFSNNLEVQINVVGGDMFLKGTVTNADGSPVDDGAYMGQLEYAGPTNPQTTDVFFKREWHERGRVLETNLETPDLVRPWKFKIAENFTGVINFTATGVTANVTTEIPPEEGSLNVTRRLNFLDERGERNEDSIFTYEGLWFPRTTTLRDENQQLSRFNYLHGNTTARLSIAVPANSTAVQLNGAVGHRADVTLQPLATPNRNAQVNLYNTIDHHRGSEGVMYFAPLDPTQRYAVIVDGVDSRYEDRNGMDLTSVDFWSYYRDGHSDEGSTQNDTAKPDGNAKQNDTNKQDGTPNGNHDKSAGNNGDSSKNKTNIGAIVGGIIGGVVVLLLIALGVYFCLRRKEQRRNGQGEKEEIPSARASDEQGNLDTVNPFGSGTHSPAHLPPHLTDKTLGADSQPVLRKPQTALSSDSGLGSYVTSSSGRESSPYSGSSIYALDTRTAGSSTVPTTTSPLTTSAAAFRQPTPRTTVAFEEDAGHLLPMGEDEEGGVAVLPPNYNPQWAEDARGRVPLRRGSVSKR